jgi:hypothetical protein
MLCLRPHLSANRASELLLIVGGRHHVNPLLKLVVGQFEIKGRASICPCSQFTLEPVINFYKKEIAA